VFKASRGIISDVNKQMEALTLIRNRRRFDEIMAAKWKRTVR